MSASEPLHDVVADNDPLQVHTAPSSIPAAGEPKDPDKPDVSNVDGQPVESVQSKWYHRLNPLRLQKIPPVPTERSTTPEYGASFLSVITFEWMSPLMRTGYLRPLVLQDIWTVSPDRKVDTLSDKLEAALKKRMASGTKNALFWALHDTFKFEFYIGGGCQLLSSLLLVFNPYLTRYLIEFATTAYVAKQTGQPAPHIGKGMGMVIGMTCMQQLGSFCSNQFMYRGHLVGGQVRAVLISHIFDKSMKLSSRAKAGCPAESTATNCQETTQDITPMTEEKDQAEKSNADAGESCGWSDSRITTLMSIDVERIISACGLFHMIWTAPISIIVILVLLVVNIGYSCLAGFALVLIGIPCLGIAMRSLAKIREKANMITDQRVCLTQEIIRDVRFVKYFGWESSFLGRLKEIRANEIRIIRGFFTLRNVIFAVTVSIPVFVPMLSFITYFLTKHTLNPSLVFSSVALFNSLRVPLNFLPTVISQATDARTALSRIQGFLFAEERKEDIEWDDKLEAAVEVEHASFTWERVPREAKKAEKPASCNETKSKPILNENPTIDVIPMDSLKLSDTALGIEPFKLNNITFRAGRNELLAVIGTVGCGKSSLLSALAGDMRLTDGTVRLSTTRSFCPQYAWVQNTSVRNNILFGKEYDETWYNEVIDACALTPDFKILPNGDLTEIGERGITVSGGQKQRMNIARAIYSNAELVLMDDPLSAVDAHVGRHIMDKAICGLLKGRCRILATHQVHVLGRCHRIIVMDEGRICAVDTFDNLMRDNETFRRLVSTSRQDIQEEENSQTDKVAHDGADNQTDFKKAMSAEPAAALMQEEEKATASVSWNVWKAYIQATGSFLNTLIIAILLSFNSGSSILTNLWLSFWSSDRYPNLSNEQYIGIYVGLGGIVSVLMFTYSNYVSTCGTNASKHMFQQAMSRVLRAPMGFFDTTPLGRITNRFSKDSQVMDNELAEAIRMLGITIGLILSVMILATVFYYYFAIVMVVLTTVFTAFTGYHRASARELTSYEAILRSTVYARFGEAITGAACLRAYGVVNQFRHTVRDSIDTMNGAYFLTFANQRWLGIRVDGVASALVFVIGVLIVTSRFDVPPSISGLVLSYTLAIATVLQMTVRQLADVDSFMNATERIYHYSTALEQEAPLHRNEVAVSWPENGHIAFKSVEMRYRAGLPLVLQGLTMDIKGGERIGIVGRTGAGKSSIMSALFRLTELSAGSITIDGIDISTVSLHVLRSRLAIIPQDPTLFKGTIRSNLDPFNEHDDLELWSALRKAYLIDQEQEPEENRADNKPKPGPINKLTLESPVDEEGLNFSLGQRQLMALSRALVRDARIVVCDEATSSVDFETDKKIQQTMIQGFGGKTLLCIAHRLHTIIHYDRICVMDKGRIAEMDAPVVLWDKADGIFRAMCERSGITREDILNAD